MLFISLRADPARCRMLAKLADAYILRSQNTWVYRPTPAKQFQQTHSPESCHTRNKPVIIFLLTIFVLSSGASQLNVSIRKCLLISKLQPSLNANIRFFSLTLF